MVKSPIFHGYNKSPGYFIYKSHGPFISMIYHKSNPYLPIEDCMFQSKRLNYQTVYVH